MALSQKSGGNQYIELRIFQINDVSDIDLDRALHKWTVGKTHINYMGFHPHQQSIKFLFISVPFSDDHFD